MGRLEEFEKRYENYSVEELRIEIDNERQAYEEIQEYEYYEDKGRQLSATRENISILQRLVGKKTGSH